MRAIDDAMLRADADFVNFCKSKLDEIEIRLEELNRRQAVGGDKKKPETESHYKPLSPLDKQVGGSHYLLSVQPIEFIQKNHLGFIEGNICKYAARHATKGKEQDVKKIIHYAKLLLKLEYGCTDEEIADI
jgi:hypothetical protein